MFNPVALLTAHGIEFNTAGKNTQEGWISIQCPLCGDGSDHGGFNLAGGYYNCWRCGSSSTAWVIRHLLNIGYTEAVRTIVEFEGQAVVTRRTREYASRVELPGKAMEPRHRKYLANLNYPRSVIEKYGLMGTGRMGRLAHRIVIPVHFDGTLVAWQCRTIVDGSPKYITSSPEESVLSVKDVLYNVDNCQQRRVIVVEGVTDVWRIGNNCVATFGIGWTTQQALLLAESFDEVHILFDSGENEQVRAKKLETRLTEYGCYAQVGHLESGDPGSMTDVQVAVLHRELC